MTKKAARNDWVLYFIKCNPSIILRTPEPTSVARARDFNRPQVERFSHSLMNNIKNIISIILEYIIWMKQVYQFQPTKLSKYFLCLEKNK